MDFRIESEPDSYYINGIRFFLQRAEPLSQTATAHIHDTIEILFAAEGSFRVQTDTAQYEIFAGDMILFRSNVVHSIFAGNDEKSSYYVLKIRPSVIRELAPPSAGGLYMLHFIYHKDDSKCVWTKAELNSTPDIVNGLERLKTEFSQNLQCADISIKLAAGNILLGILRSLPKSVPEQSLASNAKTADCIYKAMAYINKNYSSDISEKEVSSAIGLSRCYFSRTFKLVTGQSFKAYLNMTRVNHSERLLLTTDRSVGSIAAECGYNDVSYFIKVYKSHKHISPGGTRAKKP